MREMPAESSSSCCAACGRLQQVLAGANKVYLQAGFTMHAYAITVASALDLGGGLLKPYSQALGVALPSLTRYTKAAMQHSVSLHPPPSSQ